MATSDDKQKSGAKKTHDLKKILTKAKDHLEKMEKTISAAKKVYEKAKTVRQKAEDLPCTDPYFPVLQKNYRKVKEEFFGKVAFFYREEHQLYSLLYPDEVKTSLKEKEVKKLRENLWKLRGDFELILDDFYKIDCFFEDSENLFAEEAFSYRNTALFTKKEYITFLKNSLAILKAIHKKTKKLYKETKKIYKGTEREINRGFLDIYDIHIILLYMLEQFREAVQYFYWKSSHLTTNRYFDFFSDREKNLPKNYHFEIKKNYENLANDYQKIKNKFAKVVEDFLKLKEPAITSKTKKIAEMPKKIKEEREAIKNAHDTVDPSILENEFLRINIFVNTFLSEHFSIGRQPTIGESLLFKIERLAKWIWEKILSNEKFWYGVVIFFSAVAAFGGFEKVINFLKSLL